MYTSDELLKKINDYIESSSIKRQPSTLYDPIKYVLSIGGKRIRPVLVMLAYNMYRDDVERIKVFGEDKELEIPKINYQLKILKI